MPGFLREHSWPIVFSVLLHGLLVAALVLMTVISSNRAPPSMQPLPINAVVVDSRALRAAQQAQSERAQQEAARARVLAQARDAAAAEAAAQTDATAAATQQQHAADEAKAAVASVCAA